jgi:hypothetical protein
MSIKSDAPEKASNLFAPYFATYLLLHFACMHQQLLPNKGSILVCLINETRIYHIVIINQPYEHLAI